MSLQLTSTRQPARPAWSRQKLEFQRAIAMGYDIEKTSARTYNSATQSYLAFCKNHGMPITPTPDTLSFYVVYMCAYIRPSSVSSYLSGICHGLEPHFPDVRQARGSRLVTRTLAGCTKRVGAGVSRKRALSLDDLRLLRDAYSVSPSYDDILFLAITFSGFFALLRLGELVVHDTVDLRSARKVSKRYPLTVTDQHYTFNLPMHKADRFYEGNTIVVPRRSDDLNPLPIFIEYLSRRDNLHRLHPFLWIRESGFSPTRSWYISRLRRHFPSDIAGHSLRSGGATTYALAGMPDDRIQALGRWASDTFRIYIRKNPIFLQALINGGNVFPAGPSQS